MSGTVSGQDTLLGETAAVAPPPRAPEDAFAALFEPGQVIGRYVVLSVLGQGGMGVVLAAYDPELDRKVAVKLVRPDMMRSGSRDRMIREARSMARLSHPSVISVYDAGEHQGAIYIAMEFVDGKTLSDLLPSLDGWRGALEVLLPAARGLASAHAQELVHRDFKPDNVMVADDGRVLVMDFGLARADGDEPIRRSDTGPHALNLLAAARSSSALGDSDIALTRAGSMMGTPAYMPPEQFLGGRVDGRADQFSFCVTLWQAMYGERPFAGAGVWELADAVTEGRRREPPRGKAVPRWLYAILDRGLQTSPTDRFESMQALLDAIERGRSRRRNVAIAVGLLGPLVVGGAVYGANEAWEAKMMERCADEARASLPWPARADEVRAAIDEVGTSFGAETFATISTDLDAWVERFVEARSTLCFDERVEHSMSERAVAATIDCVESTSRSVDGVLETLMDGDRTMLVFAVDNIHAGTSLEPCEDTARLTRMPEAAPEIRDQARAALRDLSRTPVMQMTGDNAGALELAQKALESLESSGYAWGIAKGLVRVGSIQMTGGDIDSARVTLERGFYAAGALGDDELCAEAARLLSGVGLGSPPHGVDWVRGWMLQARMFHARLDVSSSLPEAEVLENFAAALSEAGDPSTRDEELALMREARAIRVAEAGPNHPSVLVADLNIASYEEDPKKALAALEAGRARMVDAFGTKHPLMVSLWLMTAELRADIGDRALAAEDATHAVDLSKELLGEEHPQTHFAVQVLDGVRGPAEP
ncbi:MAG: serine/threonine-protein kinase [Myxococcota bacterium]